MKNSLIEDLKQFAEKHAEKRQIEKRVFVYTVICLLDYIRTQGYMLTYIGKEHAKRRRHLEHGVREELQEEAAATRRET